jgi:hypothetical protein
LIRPRFYFRQSRQSRAGRGLQHFPVTTRSIVHVIVSIRIEDGKYGGQSPFYITRQNCSGGVEYAPEIYRPRPYSRGFVRHLRNWYAQAHPDEDFAETFAVWMAATPEEWRQRYRGWKALESWNTSTA